MKPSFLTPVPIMVTFAEIPDDVREGSTQSLVYSISAFVLEQVSHEKKKCLLSNFWVSVPGIEPLPIFWPFIVGLGTVMALVGVPFSLLFSR